MRRFIHAFGLLVTAFSLCTALATAAHAAESPAPGGQPGDNQQGTPPTVVIDASALAAGQPGTITVSLVGGDVPADAGDMSIQIIVSVDNGTVANPTVTGPFSALRTGTRFDVTPESEGAMNVQVKALPADKPEEGIGGFGTFTVGPAAPAPSPSSPEPSAAAGSAPPSAQPTKAAPTAAPKLSARSAKTPDLPTYEAMDEPTKVVDTTVTAVAVIGVIGATAAAGTLSSGLHGGGVQTPSGSSGATGGSTPSSTSSRTMDSRTMDTERHRDQIAADRNASTDHGRAEAGVSNVDATEHHDLSSDAPDRARAITPPLTAAVDGASIMLAQRVARFSPLTTRLVNDNAYLRAIFGSGAVLLPVIGLVLGVLAGLQVGGLAMAPAVTLLAVLAFIGTLDALTGLVALLAFVVVVVIGGGVVSTDSVRTLLGLVVIGCGPALIAGASRPIRRPRSTYTGWERLTDFVVIPLIGAFAAQGMVRALPGLSGYAMPIADSANTIALVVIVGLLARMTLEEFAARTYPARLAAATPRALAAPGIPQRIIVIAIRTIVFLFIAVAFIGNTWQLWVGAALFALTQLLDIVAPLMPNSPRLFHLVPVGLPKLVLILLASLGIGTLLTLVLGEDADLARMSFVLLIVPGLLITALGMFGREPAPGDTRWYQRDSMRLVYRAGGILMLALGIALTQFT